MDNVTPWHTLLEFARGHALTILKSLSILYLFGIVAYFVERIRPAEPNARFFKSDFRTELAFPVFNALVTTPCFVLFALFTTSHLLTPYAPHHVLTASLGTQPMALQVLLVLLIGDFAVYFEHRFSHGPLWPFHALHHVTPEVNWLTHARLHPINVFTIATTGLVVHFIFGIDGAAIAIATLVANVIAVWEHLNLDFAWPKPFNYLFVSPRFHRWHHADEPQAIDKNFALIFPFYDWLFGTYYCPDRLPYAYGIPGAAAGESAIPASFAGQLSYPFRRVATALRLRRVATLGSTTR